MTIQDILAKPEFKDVIAELTKNKYPDETDKYIEQYTGKHEILKKMPRSVTYNVTDKDGAKTKKTELVPLAKLPVSFQESGVKFATSMLYGKQLKYNLKNKKMGLLGKKNKFDEPMNFLLDVLYQNKISYFNRQKARKVMSECRAVVYWYIRPSDTTIHVQLWCKTLGSLVYPYFDEYGNLIAISREYTTTAGDKTLKHFDIYTAEKTIKATEDNSVWTQVQEGNPHGKITGVYYEFGKPVWTNVQPEIDRYEYSISRLCDSNDSTAYPDIVAKVASEDDITNFPRSGTTGNIFAMTPNISADGAPTWGELSYLESDNAVDSIKLELETLEKIIYGKMAVVDLSFSNVKGLATNLSGIAIDLMFMDARLEALANEEVFGAGERREISILKTLCGYVEKKYKKLYEEMKIVPEFQNPLPTDVETLINLLSIATGNKQFMSVQSAIDRNVLVEDAEDELERIQGEPQEGLGESMQL